MATMQAPNPRDFTSADQAFAYPLPVVRKLEQQLRSSIADNKDKLRSLVGASYRDVLSTADRIVEMNSEMQRLDGVLGGIGRRCNASAIERVAGNQRLLSGSRREDLGAKRKVAAEVALLQRVIGVAGRMVRKGEGVLVVAKLLVLARLLHGSLAKGGEKVAMLESLRNNVATLRRKLMAVIDRQVTDGKVERMRLIDLLTAFSLATSSTPTDVLRHFLSVRQSVMKELIENSSERKQEAIVKTLDLLFTTLEQVQTIFPKRMADSLARLKLTRLLQDTDVRAIAELDLDLYERWIADDVRKYTSWPRHDELQISQARQMVEPWTLTTSQIVQEGIRNVTAALDDNGEVVRMREQVIKHLLGSPRNMMSLDKESMLESFRGVFMKRLENVMESRSKAVCTVVAQALEQKQAPSKSPSLWHSSMADFELGRGAHKFRSEIVARSLGKDQNLQRLTSSLKWSRSLEDMRKTIKDMRSTRWEEDLDLDEDDDLEAGKYQDSLGKEDPNALSLRLDSTVKGAFEDTITLLGDAVTTEGTSDDGERYIFLFRLTREVARQPNFPSAADAYHTLLEKLYTTIAAHIAGQSLQYLRKRSDQDPSIPFNRTPALILWEGTPQLPVQPSPASIRLLHELRKVMQGAGPDLWTKSAVDAVKKVIQSKIAASIKTVVVDVAQPVIASTVEREAETVPKSSEDVPTNGQDAHEGNENDVTTKKVADEKKEDEQEKSTEATTAEVSTQDAALSQRQIATQALYDVLYLQKLLAITPMAKDDRNDVQDVVDALKEKSGVETASMERLQRSSMDYYKKTYLLFAILSPP